jgi:hypothetical protein
MIRYLVVPYSFCFQYRHSERSVSVVEGKGIDFVVTKRTPLIALSLTLNTLSSIGTF